VCAGTPVHHERAVSWAGKGPGLFQEATGVCRYTGTWRANRQVRLGRNDTCLVVVEVRHEETAVRELRALLRVLLPLVQALRVGPG